MDGISGTHLIYLQVFGLVAMKDMDGLLALRTKMNALQAAPSTGTSGEDDGGESVNQRGGTHLRASAVLGYLVHCDMAINTLSETMSGNSSGGGGQRGRDRGTSGARSQEAVLAEAKANLIEQYGRR